MKLENVINLDGEIWKKLKYKKLEDYLISNMGRIYSLSVKKILKGSTNGDNHYLRMRLFDRDGNRENIAVHRMVALIFIKNNDPKNKNEVNHIDGNQMNNKVSNLEWVSRSENMQHVADMRLKSKNIRICMLDSKSLKILKIFRTKIAIKNKLILNTIYRNIDLDNKWVELKYLKKKYPELIDDFNNELPKDLVKLERKSRAIRDKFKIVCLYNNKNNSIFYLFMNVYYALKKFKLNTDNVNLTLNSLPKIKGYYWKYLEKNTNVNIIDIIYDKQIRNKLDKIIENYQKEVGK